MRGVGFHNVKQFVLNWYGETVWQSVVRSLPEVDRHTADFGLAVGWYEVAAFARLLRAVDQICGRGDLSLLPRVGASEAEQDFNRVYRVILRSITPAAFLAAERRIWRQFQDSGSWEWHKIKGGIIATLTGWAVDHALCLELGGYLVRIVEFTGGRSASFEHSECRALGAHQCTFMLYWS